MSYYHATFAERIDAILREGLGCGAVRNFPTAEEGVYLSTDPILAVGFLIEHLMNADESINPSERLKTFRVIVVDRSRVDETRLAPDPQIDTHRGFFWLYDGVIDVTGMPILDVEQIMTETMIDKA